jgi:hypothetical protein
MALILVALFALPIRTFSQDEPPSPTPLEREALESKLAIIIKHQGLLPYPVDDVIRSLTDTLLIRFECSKGYRVENVEIKITTKQIRWSRRVQVGDEIHEHPADVAGFYVWRPTAHIKNNRKRIIADNWVMVDTSSTFLHGLPLPFPEATILYHELLHGQLQIDALYQEAWRRQSCVCYFDTEATDGEHLRIPEFTKGYLRNLAGDFPDIYSIDVPLQEQPGDGGKFVLDVTDLLSLEENRVWQTIYYYPEGANVMPPTFRIDVEDERVLARGMLVDQTKAGFLLVYIKPHQ